MVLKRIALVCAIALAAPGLWAQTAPKPEPKPGEVNLPLKDYLTLVESAEAGDLARERRVKSREAPLAEVVSQRASARVENGEARVTSEFEVLVQGHPDKPATLTLAGYPALVEIRRDGAPVAALSRGEPAAASAIPGGSGGMSGIHLVAAEPGRYAVRVLGRVPLQQLGGIQRLTFPAAVAAVSVTEIDLPADSSWTAPGGVVVEERERDGRRTVRLAAKRGEAQVLEMRRKVDSAEAEKLLAQSVVLTIFQLRPEGARRHDVVLYEVSRGGLGSFAVELPPGVEVEQAATDEGPAVPVVESGRLTVHRHRQLRGTGYLVLTSTPEASGPGPGPAESPLQAARPETPVRARYLAVSSSIAAEAKPLPEASWSRVDLDDLPPVLREALQVIDLAAAWRLSGEEAGARLAIHALPAAPGLDAVARFRETTTLLTVDGTLLHRDVITLGPSSRGGAALDLVLPAGATLWSARVADQPVRPLDRGGKVSVPLGFASGTESRIEVIVVLEKAVPAGRSQLALELPQVAVPVLDHRWRLLLPEGSRYRFRDGDLRPVTEEMVVRSVDYDVEEREKTAVHGPGGNAGLAGTVVDEEGGPLPGVTVTLQPPAGPPIRQVTNAKGQFRMIGLAPGTYRLKAELEGFSSVEYPNVSVNAGRSTGIEVSLYAAVEETITVTAESPLLDERRLSTGATIDMDELEGRPSAGSSRRREKKEQERRDERRAELNRSRLYAQEAEGLQQGLVGGVKPLPIAIPEAGKALLLTGVLPPSKVTAALEVKAKR